ncbi:MAG: hypothetical protein WBG73_11310 [Coleofasciculaceae cyanobacterium]
MQWPEHFPTGCPPQTAHNTSGEVYRLINNDSPMPNDFRSWREENKDKECPNGVTECQACGLSVYTEKADAYRVIKRIPRFRKAKPALGNLTTDLGLTLHTPSNTSQSHHTWWIPSGKQPWTVFQIVYYK